jgi:hypothetical protein
MRGLDPTHKAARLANYLVVLRKEMLQLSRACGKPHPALVTLDAFDVIDPGFVARPARDVFGYGDRTTPRWSPDQIREIEAHAREAHSTLSARTGSIEAARLAGR